MVVSTLLDGKTISNSKIMCSLVKFNQIVMVIAVS